MSNPLKTPASTNIGLLLARVPMGAYLALAGFGKLTVGVTEFAAKPITDAWPFVPEALSKGYVQAVPYVEILAGALIMLGWFTRSAALVASLILTVVLATIAGADVTAGPFSPNIVFLGLTVMLLMVGPGGIALDSIRFRRSTAAPKPAD